MTVSQIVDQHTSTAVRSYPREAGPVVAALKDALAAREQQIVEALISGGVSLGARREQVESLLVTAGLVEPTPEPEPVASEPTPLEGSIEERVTRIETSVAALVRLAEDRLGVRVGG